VNGILAQIGYQRTERDSKENAFQSKIQWKCMNPELFPVA
jgi:hypothetical protein